MTEANLQSSIIRYFNEAYPQHRRCLFHIPNETRGKANFHAASQGIVAGVPDLCLVLPDSKVAWFELKTPTGQLSEKQKRTHTIFAEHGHHVHLIRSIEDFKAVLLQFSNLIPKLPI